MAQFNISSHFDIIRDYNTQTGEQLNVIVENTTDRPWYERQYMRVDWSKNLVTDAYDFDLLSLATGATNVKFDSLSYYVEDPSDPNAPVFDQDAGYFDVTTKVFATPLTVQNQFGTYPVCLFFNNSPNTTCNPAEVTVRVSFKKVVDDDFEPEDWDGNKMNAFGWFTVDRYGYDRNYGILDQDWHRFAAKHNIWQASHWTGTQCAVDYWRDSNGKIQNYKTDGSGNFLYDANSGLPIPDPSGQPFTKSAIGQDPNRDLDGDGTQDECQFTDANGNELNPGSRCDTFTNKCDLPLYTRQTKTTPFYYGPTAPPDLFPSTAQALSEWNLAVKRRCNSARRSRRIASVWTWGNRAFSRARRSSSPTSRGHGRCRTSSSSATTPSSTATTPRADPLASRHASATFGITSSTSSRIRSPRRRGAS